MHLPPLIADGLDGYGTLFLICAVCGFPIPFPEDVVLITVGTVVAAGKLEFWKAALVCGLAMFVRDLNAFLVARALSHWLVERPWVRRFVGEKNLERWSRLFERRGGLGIFLVRFAVGTRVKLLFIAAALGVRVRTFIVFDLLGMLIVSPLLLWLGFRFGEPLAETLFRILKVTGPALLGLAAAVVALLTVLVRRRMAAGPTARP